MNENTIIKLINILIKEDNIIKKEELPNFLIENFISVNKRNIIKKGTKFTVLREENLSGKSPFDSNKPYKAILESSLVTSKQLEVPYTFKFKTDSALIQYEGMYCVNQIRDNKYEVRTKTYDFLIEIE